MSSGYSFFGVLFCLTLISVFDRVSVTAQSLTTNPTIRPCFSFEIVGVGPIPVCNIWTRENGVRIAYYQGGLLTLAYDQAGTPKPFYTTQVLFPPLDYPWTLMTSPDNFNGSGGFVTPFPSIKVYAQYAVDRSPMMVYVICVKTLFSYTLLYDPAWCSTLGRRCVIVQTLASTAPELCGLFDSLANSSPTKTPAVAITTRPTVFRPTVRPTLSRPTVRPTLSRPTARPTNMLSSSIPRSPIGIPTARPSTRNPILTPTRNPISSPTKIPTQQPSVLNDYSSFVFMGDSMFQYLLCYNQTDDNSTQAASPETINCITQAIPYFDNVTNLDVRKNCTAAPDTFYCNSTFYYEFPGAINIALRRSRVNDWITTIPLTPRYLNVEAYSPPIKYILFELGINDVIKLVPPATLLAEYFTLIKNVNLDFPLCHILILSINPCTAGATSNPTYIRNKDAVNAGLEATFSNRTMYPKIHFFNTTSYFYDDFGLKRGLFNADGLHFTKFGYELFLSGIHEGIDRMLAKTI